MSIRNKILAIIFSILFLFVCGILFTVSYITGKSFSSYLSGQERREAEWLAMEFENWYSEKESWQGVQSLFKRRGVMGMYGHFEDRGRMRGRRVNQVILTDFHKKVLYNNLSFDRREVLEGEGISIKVEGKTVGYLYMGGMAGQALSESATLFLQEVQFSVVVSSLLFFLIIVILLTLFIRKMLFPLSKLSQSAKEVGRGNYNSVIPLPPELKKGEKDEVLLASKAFNQMTRSLKEREESRNSLLNSISHELRTPLTLLRGELEMIKEEVKTFDEKTLNSLYGETEILLSLAEEVRRVGENKKELLLKSLDIKKILEEVKIRFESTLKERGASFSIIGESSFIKGEKVALIRLFSNLTDNALRYLPQSEKGAIEAEIEVEKKSLSVFFQDNGEGIEKSKREKVFEPFYRIEESRNRKSGGQGLGLSICQEITKKHSGYIEIVNSKWEGGSRFKVSFPKGD